MIEAANHIVFPLASWLVTYLIQSTLFLATALIVTRYFFRKSARTRKLIILSAMLAPLLGATLHLLCDSTPVKYHTNGPSSTAVAVPLSSATFADWFTAEEIDLSIPVRMQGNDNRTLVLNRSDMNRFLIFSILLAAWLSIVLILGLRFAAGWRSFRRRIAARQELQIEPLQLMLDKLCTRGNIKRRIRLTCSTGIRHVTAMGFSEICIPARHIPELEPDEVQNVLAHELTHLKNYDPILMVAAGLFKVLFFFQPLNRVATIRLQEVSEFLADEGALELTKKPAKLANALLKLARAGRRHIESSLALNFSSGKPMLVDRARKILDWSHDSRSKRCSLPIRVGLAMWFVFIAWVYPGELIPIHRFWNGKPFSPPNLLADQSWHNKREIKLVLPSGERLNFKLSRVYIDTRTAEICKAPHSESFLILDKLTENRDYRIEIHGVNEEPDRKHFYINGSEKSYDDAAASLLRDALLVMIDND